MIVTNAGHEALGQTWLEPEQWAYNRSFGRRAKVRIRPNPHNPVVLPYGALRMVRAGIPDTFFSIPARFRYARRIVKGFISKLSGEDEFSFTPEADPAACVSCAAGEGCKKG